MRVVSWNLAYRVGDAARREGEFLADLDPQPNIVMLQEVNRRSIDLVCERAGLAWATLAVDLRVPEPDDTPVRQRGVALAGRGTPAHSAELLTGVRLPERTIHAYVPWGGRDIRIASYHAPPGVAWFAHKAQQAVAFADWLANIHGPVVLGADANTPFVDHPDFESVRTHWHTGRRRLNGAPGDDRLWAASKSHRLEDALRLWLAHQPHALAAIKELRPNGPLAVSHRTGKRRTSAGTDRRFDSIWVSDHFNVTAVDYPYEASIQAGSDHSAVVVDLEFVEPTANGRASSDR